MAYLKHYTIAFHKKGNSLGTVFTFADRQTAMDFHTVLNATNEYCVHDIVESPTNVFLDISSAMEVVKGIDILDGYADNLADTLFDALLGRKINKGKLN